MKRIMSLLLTLLLCVALTAPALAEEAAVPLTAIAYTSDKLLWVGPLPLAGLTVINGEYYLPMELLNANGKTEGGYYPLSYCVYGNGIGLETRSYTCGEVLKAVKPVVYATPGLELGAVTPVTEDMMVSYRDPAYHDATLPAGSVYSLGGYYPMVRLKALAEYYGYREAEDGIHICESYPYEEHTVVWEEDLVGQAAKELKTNDTKATLKAFHDYLIKKMTHFGFIDDAYFQKSDPQRHERYDQMWEKYECENNAALASGYGVCADYANMFQAMCNQNGTPCVSVGSMAMNHAWNRVWLWGEWYHVDVTFDDPGPKPSSRDTYFLVSAEKMMRSHCWDGPDFTMPDTYDPAWAQIDPKNLTSADQYRKCLAAQLVQGKTKFSLHPVNAEAFGGSGGPVAWALNRYDVPAWNLRWTYTYNSATKSYDYSVTYG